MNHKYLLASLFLLIPIAASGETTTRVIEVNLGLPAVTSIHSDFGNLVQFWPLTSGEAYVIVQTGIDKENAFTLQRNQSFTFVVRTSKDELKTIGGVISDSWYLRGRDVYLGVTDHNKNTTWFNASQITKILRTGDNNAMFDNSKH